MKKVKFFDDNWETYIDSLYDIHYPQKSNIDKKIKYSNRYSAHLKNLIDSIGSGNSVVYVGAGVSKAAGLPDWREFLVELETECRLYSSKAAKSVSEKIESGDFLLAAEMLHNIFGNKLQDITHRVFGKYSTPSVIHKAIASIPFSLAITTNYDCLLENSYANSVPRLTWQNPLDVLQNLRSGLFCVLKLHGDYAVRDSVVLAKSHYRSFMHSNSALLNSLRMLLSTRTFLFVGVSFSDPDLLMLLDEAKSLYGDVFGPHYAIFPERYHDAEYSKVLEKSYNIRTIIAPESERGNSENEKITNGVTEVLAHFGGMAAFDSIHKPKVSILRSQNEDLPFDYRPAGERTKTGELLKHAVNLLGLSRGEICVSRADNPEHRIIYKYFNYTASTDSVIYERNPVFPVSVNSVQHQLFYQRKNKHDYVYISDTNRARYELDIQGFQNADYVADDKKINSLLCVPIYVDGKRSGVLTLESERGFIFSRYHYYVAKMFAHKIGASRNESRRFSDSASMLKRYTGGSKYFVDQLRRSRDLDDLDLECLVFQIDAYSGELVAKTDDRDIITRNDGEDKIIYRFEDRALAAESFRKRRTIRIPDVDKALGSNQSILARKGVELFSIEGPIVSFPVHVRGYTAGVFVGWSGGSITISNGVQNKSISDNRIEVMFKNRFWRGMERARRFLHVLANEPILQTGSINSQRKTKESSRAVCFLESISKALSPIDKKKSWGKKVKEPGFRAKVISALLSVLVDPSCGLKRTRLFAISNDAGQINKIKCVGAAAVADADHPDVDSINGYKGVKIDPGDNYVKQIFYRSKYDGYARLLDQNILNGEPDPSLDVFHKVPGKPWIVSPVGVQLYDWKTGEREEMKIFGYLAADDFYWNAEKKKMIDATEECVNVMQAREEFVFKRYCMDFVSDILSILMKYESESI